MAHVMLRSLDDGQTGFGESSLAEWVVPEALTFAIYVSGHQSYTLGALWTLLHTRSRARMDRVVASVWRYNRLIVPSQNSLCLRTLHVPNFRLSGI